MLVGIQYSAARDDLLNFLKVFGPRKYSGQGAKEYRKMGITEARGDDEGVSLWSDAMALAKPLRVAFKAIGGGNAQVGIDRLWGGDVRRLRTWNFAIAPRIFGPCAQAPAATRPCSRGSPPEQTPYAGSRYR